MAKLRSICALLLNNDDYDDDDDLVIDSLPFCLFVWLFFVVIVAIAHLIDAPLIQAFQAS